MALQIILNILIAILWMFLKETYDFLTFFTGYLIGMALLFFLRRFVPDSYYLLRFFKVISLILLFIKELILSTWSVVKIAYQPKLNVQPGIFALPTELRSNWEITLLANLISLTPGTLSVAVSDDYTKIYIHAMDMPDVEESINDIKNTFERAIMEVTR
ncbi:Na+/H+ antiporter subunit E [Tenuibacillus multivorans]|uniref:Multicomponent Na+:H+ antiporter subunit E n=1 Tax=Tenuibacillus multivorans TaxID=237069 RepID=A0A1G9ZIR9_9BACI|nr:Na+/H+ antiporter subunit E [Tenuibacillus multivorans]GEL77512.1 cation:proton antiporter [Tenuibacillus multivorans]SDN20403.1 multicomponent Na+:H+ antiporter subunit E [Tenuibacillus multivorans]